MSVDSILANLKTQWAGGASDSTKADTDATMAAIRAQGQARNGQTLTISKAEEAQGRRRLQDAVTFGNDLLAWLGAEVTEQKLTRWQGYFAASLLAVNLWHGSPEDSSKTKDFERAAGNAQEWWTAKNPGEVRGVAEVSLPEPVEADITKGAAVGQNLLDYFETEVTVRGLDRWQGHFAAALLTIELRGSCPSDQGGTRLFDAASEVAWKYFDAAQ